MIAQLEHPKQRTGTAVVAVLLCLAALGASLGVRSLFTAGSGSAGAHGGHDRAGLPGLAIDVPTSFGVVAVEHAEAVAALRPGDMTMSGGPAGAAPAGTMEVTTAGVISNLQKATYDYSPDQFTLIGKHGKEYKVTRSVLQPGTLQPFSSVDVQNVYRVPTGSGPFTMRFAERGHPPVFISLEDTGDNPSAGSGHTSPSGGVDGKATTDVGGSHGGH